MQKAFKGLVSVVLAAVMVAGVGPVGLFSVRAEAAGTVKTGDDGTTNWGFIVPMTHQKTVPDGYKGIYTAQDLNNMRDDLSGKYILMNDIDLSSWKNWEPVGEDSTNRFKGEFDGNGYVIKNMAVDARGYAGFFGCVGSGEIKNIGVVNSSVNGYGSYNVSAGAIAGSVFSQSSESVSISNCYNTGKVNSNGYSGGIVGEINADHMSISNCYNTGDIKSSNSTSNNSAYASAGGIAGYVSPGSYRSISISYCYNIGSIDSVVSYSASTALGANVNSVAGGVVGAYSYPFSDYPLYISDCYNIGNISSSSSCFSYSPNLDYFSAHCRAASGGIIGSSYKSSDISNCYNAGEIQAESSTNAIGGPIKLTGGIVGDSSSADTLNNCYYLKNLYPAAGNEEAELTNVKALTSDEMKKQASYKGFDFDKIWGIDTNINNGYPYLKKPAEEPHTHTWGGWEVTIPATNDKEGEETRQCSVCPEKDTRVIQKLSNGKPNLNPNPTPVPNKIGDIDADGEITASDARLILRHVAKLQILEGDALTAADVNGDGVVDASDARLVLRYVAKLIDKF